MKKRLYCKCPYCPYLSSKYEHVKQHVISRHPLEQFVVLERYDRVIEDELREPMDKD